jgi:anti-sigma regulatory factor (Ser/Thr protein kinase)
MPEAQTLLVPGGRTGFAQAAAQLSDLLDRCAIEGRPRRRAELVFEEVVTNVIRHAYGHDESRQIEVEFACDADGIRFVFTDDGPAFDPLAQPEPERPSSLEAAREGGLGIFLVRKIASAIAYDRTSGRNRLRVTVAAT